MGGLRRTDLTAPVNGAPALNRAFPLEPQAPEDEDLVDTQMLVHRMPSTQAGKTDCASALGANPGKDACLAHGQCMWISLGDAADQSRCLPCELDGQELPCWAAKSRVDGVLVNSCEMRCAHQKRLIQPEEACVDSSGTATQNSCWARGTESGSSCMHIAYTDEKGVAGGVCAPCKVQGTGAFGCPAVGGGGPGLKTTVTACASQCDVVPDGDVVLPGGPTNMATASVSARQMVDSPFAGEKADAAKAAKALEAAALAAAEAAAPPEEPPADVYTPVVMYRRPDDYLAAAPPLSLLARREKRHK